MNRITVTVIAVALVALVALVLAVSYMTSTETCRYDYDTYGGTTDPFWGEPSPEPGSPGSRTLVGSTTCSRHFWWQ